MSTVTETGAGLPAVWDIDAYRGDSWSQTFRFLRGDEPVDLSGATVEAWARGGSGADPIPLVVVLGAPGEVSIQFPVDGLPWQTYLYDVEVTQDGVVQTWVRGKLRVVRDVTNEQPA